MRFFKRLKYIAALGKKEKEINERIEAYLEKPTHCLICGDDEIVGGSIDIDCGIATQFIRCSSCGTSWTDVYRLQNVCDVKKEENCGRK